MKHLDITVLGGDVVSTCDTVQYGDLEYEVKRIDGHTHPICLGGGIRVTPDQVRKVKVDTNKTPLRVARDALRKEAINLKKTLQTIEAAAEVLDALIGKH